MHKSPLEDQENGFEIKKKKDNAIIRVYTDQKTLYFDFKLNKIQLLKATSALIFIGKKRIEYHLPTIKTNQKTDIAKFEPKLDEFTDELGKGTSIKIEITYMNQIQKDYPESPEIGGIPCVWYLKFYESINSKTMISQSVPFISSQIMLKSHESLTERWKKSKLLGYAPLFCKEHGNLQLHSYNSSGIPESKTFYSNGWQSWSLNYTLNQGEKWPSSPVKLARINMENQDQRIKGNYQSEYHTIISNLESQSSLVLGFISLDNQFSRILMDPLSETGNITFLCAYSQTDGIPLAHLNEASQKSEILMISLVENRQSYECLTEICRMGGILAKARIDDAVLAGWCSWYYYYTKITEQEMIKNLDFFKQHREIPINLIQLDDGYQTWIGDWGLNNLFNEKFPHGLKWLVEQVHASQFKAGLWVAPFFTTKEAKLYLKHPEWALRDKNSKLINTCTNWGHKSYGIDLTLPEVLKYLTEIGDKVANEWGFDFLKIDFLYAGVPYGAVVKNPYLTRAQQYRQGVEAIRNGIGDQTVLLGCGAPLGPCVGLVDVMRIGMDTKEQWGNQDWLFQKIGKVAMPSLHVALRSTIQRSYMHNTWWINDPDCVIVRENNCKLTMDEILLQLTIFGLSGGQIIISDEEEKVGKDRLDLLTRILPPYNPPLFNSNENKTQPASQAIPLDISKSNFPKYYVKTVDTKFGYRHLIAIINWENIPNEESIQLKNMMSWDYVQLYTDEQQFAIFDYWNEEFLGIFDNTQTISSISIPPHGCRYLSLTPITKQENLAFLSSTFHICQGALEIINLEIKSNVYNIKISLPGKRTGNLYFFVRSEYEFNCSTFPYTITDCVDGKIAKVHFYLSELTEIKVELIQK